MSGFSGIVIFDKSQEIKLKSFQFPEKLQGYYTSDRQYGNEFVEFRAYNNGKFQHDNFLTQKNGYVAGFDGVNLSGKTLNSDLNETQFVQNCTSVKGTFSSLFYDNKEQQLTLIADQTGSRQVFYYWNSSFFAFSSSIFLLVSVLKHFDIRYTISDPASYMILSLGYLMEDYTLVSEIKKVTAGHFVRANKSGVKIEKYHDYYRKTEYEKITDELLEEINARFVKSLSLEYEKDREYGYDHIATLSGGLDSRLNVMTAHKNGYSDMTCVTFSEGFKSDELTARKITKDHSFKHLVLLLNNGFQLYDIETPLILNNCAVHYFGAAQTLAAVKRINFSRYGLFHNGILAESSKGSYLSGRKHLAPFLDRHYRISEKMFDRIDTSLVDNILNRYPNDEMFLTYSRGFNAAHNGSWMTMPFTDSVSTFMETDFADLAYAIHPKLKYKGFLTVEWIKKFNPESGRYPWQRGIKPTNDPLRLLIARVLFRIKLTISGKEDIPVPIKEWYSSSEHLQNFIRSEYDHSPSWDILPKNLKEDLAVLFQGELVEEKLLAISYLKSIELLFCR